MKVGPKAVVAGKDFDPDTGEIKETLDASKLVSPVFLCSVVVHATEYDTSFCSRFVRGASIYRPGPVMRRMINFP